MSKEKTGGMPKNTHFPSRIHCAGKNTPGSIYSRQATMVKAALAIAAVTLAGCASQQDQINYTKAQTDAAAAWQANAKPLFKLTAIKGQTITGIESLEVNMPSQAPQIQQLRSEWAGVVGQSINAVSTLGGIWLGGKAAVGLATAVGNAAGQGYQYVQAPAVPQANITTTTTNTIGGDGNVGSGSLSKTDSRNVTTTTTTDTHNTTSTDSHAVTNPITP